jgi:hypothetical protein
MLRRVALVRTDISEDLSASFIRVTRIGELGTTLAATSNRRMLRRLLVCLNIEYNLHQSIYLILPAVLGPGVYSASNRNEYQKHKNNVSGE